MRVASIPWLPLSIYARSDACRFLHLHRAPQRPTATDHNVSCVRVVVIVSHRIVSCHRIGVYTGPISTHVLPCHPIASHCICLHSSRVAQLFIVREVRVVGCLTL